MIGDEFHKAMVDWLRQGNLRLVGSKGANYSNDGGGIESLHSVEVELQVNSRLNDEETWETIATWSSDA